MKYFMFIVLILFGNSAICSELTDSLTIAGFSFVPEKWDKPANVKKIESMTRQAVDRGAKLVVMPEGALEGYVVNDVINEKDAVKKAALEKQFAALAEPIDGENISQLYNLADELDIYFVICFLEAKGTDIYNSAVFVGPDGKQIGCYHKTHFWQGYEVNPPGYITGDSFPVFPLGNMNLGIMICADRRFPEVARSLMLNGTDLIVNPAYGNHGELNTALMRTRAFENQTFVVFSHPMHSLIIDNDGNILNECGTDSLVLANIPWRKVEKKRPTVRFRRPQLYKVLTQ